MEAKAKSGQTRRKKVTVGYLHVAVTRLIIGVQLCYMRMSSTGVGIYVIDSLYYYIYLR